jgi:threonine/homoserine/homoserine lactone efflux protein
MARRGKKKKTRVSTGLGCAIIVVVLGDVGWISENDLWPAVFGTALFAVILWLAVKLARGKSKPSPSKASSTTRITAPKQSPHAARIDIKVSVQTLLNQRVREVGQAAKLR